MTEINQQSKDKIPEELKELIIARLNLIPDNVTVSVGADGEFTRAELIESVKREDMIGQEVVRSQLEFLRALSAGKILDELAAEAN